MAMEAFPVVVRAVKVDWIVWLSQILNVNMVKPSHLGPYATIIDCVIGVAGVAGFIARDPAVLKMCCGDITGIVNIETFSVRSHNVAREAECGFLGAFHVVIKPKQGHEAREYKQTNEG
jgi:hypothetical protein